MTHQEFKERLEEIQYYLVDNVECSLTIDKTPKHACCYSQIALKKSTQSLIALFEDYTKEIVGDYEITEENQDNGHDCYEKFCDYCDKGTRDDFRQTINQTSKTILRGDTNDA